MIALQLQGLLWHELSSLSTGSGSSGGARERKGAPFAKPTESSWSQCHCRGKLDCSRNLGVAAGTEGSSSLGVANESVAITLKRWQKQKQK